ncbi:MAG: hypothetical protein KKE05_06285, partial [Nanoarchaeota archaeon]|nr:hypothetical protein [Nanoarchaeota archaeon]
MERFISVTGWSKHHRQMDSLPGLDESAKGPRDTETGYVVYWWDGTKKNNLTVDADEPVTLKRCTEILTIAENKTGNTY